MAAIILPFTPRTSHTICETRDTSSAVHFRRADGRTCCGRSPDRVDGDFRRVTCRQCERAIWKSFRFAADLAMFPQLPPQVKADHERRIAAVWRCATVREK